MFDFVAIDFEAADAYIPCSLGMAVVKNSEIVERRHWLIKPICYPYFHFYAQRIHGIHKKDVMNEPEFDVLWKEIEPYFEGKTIVAHNASFDINVLRKTLKHYGIPKPEGRYLCTFQISRLVWPSLPKHSLDYLCERQGYVFEHHRADADAEACAVLLLKEAEALQVNDLEELRKRLKIRLKKL